jgi:hypothetical protein
MMMVMMMMTVMMVMMMMKDDDDHDDDEWVMWLPVRDFVHRRCLLVACLTMPWRSVACAASPQAQREV